MKKALVLLSIMACAFVVSCTGGSSGKVLVSINGEKITEGTLIFLGEINPRLQAQISNPVGQKKVLDNLVEQNLLYQEAIKRGVNRDSKVKAKIDLYRQIIIAQSLLDAEAEKAAKKYYDEHQDEFKKLKMSQIMIKYASPDEIKKAKKGEKLGSEEAALKLAEDVKARIDNGEDFATVAKDVSDDLSTKTRGGDLGPVSKDDKMVQNRGFGPLVEKAFELKVGEIAGPIKTDKGYHIITVTKALELEPFDQAKESILFKTRADSKNDILTKLKKDAKIIYPEEEKAKAAAQKKAEEQAKPEEPAKTEEIKKDTDKPAVEVKMEEKKEEKKDEKK